MPALPSGVGPIQIIKSTQEGLSQALRWFHQDGFTGDVLPKVERQVIGDAGMFSQFAGKYVDIADLHKMHGQGQVEVIVDEAVRKIRFDPQPNSPGDSPLSGAAATAHNLANHPMMKTPQEFEHIREKTHAAIDATKFHTDAGRVVLDDPLIANCEGIVEMLAAAFPKEALWLGEDADLVGFSLGEFSTYFEALRRWSQCALFVFVTEVLKKRKQQWECIPTPVVPLHSFFETMQSLSGLSEVIVRRITERLAYDNRTKNPDVFQQPLFVGPTLVAWSASAVLDSKYLRNMLKLMSRTPALRNHTATLIGSQDGATMRELGQLLSQRGGMQFKLHTEIVMGALEGEIDLLAYSTRFPEEVLVVEGKALLGVDEINEVASATKEMQKGQGQLRDAISMLSQMDKSIRKGLFKFVNWDAVTTIKGVVVALDAEPNELFDHSEFPGISLQSIKSRLRDNHLSSPVKFWTACHERRWLSSLRKYHRIHLPVKVGDVTYELPGLERLSEDADER